MVFKVLTILTYPGVITLAAGEARERYTVMLFLLLTAAKRVRAGANRHALPISTKWSKGAL